MRIISQRVIYRLIASLCFVILGGLKKHDLQKSSIMVCQRLIIAKSGLGKFPYG